MSQCKFLETKIVQNICHEICHNPEMLAINKPTSDKSLACIGEKCGMAVYDSSANNAKTSNS